MMIVHITQIYNKIKYANFIFTVAALVIAFIAAAAILPSGLPLGVIFLGTVNGGLYGLTALGIVLLYKSQKIINFSQASLGGIAVAVAVVLVDKFKISYFFALVVGLSVAALTGFLTELLVVRRLRKSSRMILTVATLGVAQVIGALQIAIPGWFNVTQLGTYGTPFHFQFYIFPFNLTGDYVVALAALIICLALLWFFLEKTDTGIALRAVSDSIDRARLLGIPTKRISIIAWVIAALLAAVAGLASAPASMSNPPDLTIAAGPVVLLAPLAAAIIGRMTNLVITTLAGCIIGIFQQAIFWSYPKSTIVDVGLFIVIVVSLLIQPPIKAKADQLLNTGYTNFKETRPVAKILNSLPSIKVTKFVLIILLLGAAIFIPLNSSQINVLPYVYIEIYAIVAVSLVILSGWAGQISLGQFGFAGVGAAVTSVFLVSYHADLLLALTMATIIGALASMIVGVPSLKINGLFLSVATLAFAVPVDTFLLNATNFPSLNPPHLNPPLLFSHFDLSNIRVIYEFALGIVVICVYLANNIRRSRAGRAFVGLRENEPAAEAYGIDPIKLKLAAFGISGAMASLAGGLYVILQQGASFSGFDPQLSISAFSIVVIGGLTSLPGAILASIYYGIISFELHGAVELLASGVALLILLLFLPNGLGGIITSLRDRAYLALAKRKGIEAVSPQSEPFVASSQPVVLFESIALPKSQQHPKVELKNINARYHQVQVLFDVNMQLAENNITAILGTNGAGKSTILKTIAGLMENYSGNVYYESKDITKVPAEERVRMGIVTVPGGRGIFPSLTVKENLQLAKWLYKKDLEFTKSTLEKIYGLFPVLSQRLDSKAWMLSGGEQQMLTISQALLCKPKILLIDELSLGLAPIVVAELIKVVQELADSGIAVGIVEQSINVATSISPKSVFLERGQVKFDGNSKDLLKQSDMLRSIFIDPSMNFKTHEKSSLKADPQKVFKAEYLSKHFGGIMAVNEVSIEISSGEIHGIIGANGAGKTTLFDICSGFIKPDQGQLSLNGTNITHYSATKRAVLGLGRVFQHAQLFPALTVHETVALAHERFIFPKEPISAGLRLPSVIKTEQDVRDSVNDLLDFFHLGDFQNTFISELSTGTRRIVELACSMAHRPTILLLDEPSSGLAQKESEALVELLFQVSEKTNAALLIIEHDIPLIAAVASHLTCLHLGDVIASGTPREVLSSQKVIDSYLGSDQIAIDRSNSS